MSDADTWKRAYELQTEATKVAQECSAYWCEKAESLEKAEIDIRAHERDTVKVTLTIALMPEYEEAWERAMESLDD